MTTTISTRLDDDEVALLDSLSRLAGFDRSTLLKLIVRKGIGNMRMELAVEKYRNEKLTLSKASELAGVGQWDFIARMRNEGLELHYDVEDFEADLASLAKAT